MYSVFEHIILIIFGISQQRTYLSHSATRHVQNDKSHSSFLYFAGGLPGGIRIQIQAGFDITLFDHFERSIPRIHDYIASVIELSKPNFRGANSLPFKVILKWSPQIKNVGFGTRADDFCIDITKGTIHA